MKRALMVQTIMVIKPDYIIIYQMWESQGIARGGSFQSVLHLLLHILICIGSHAFHEGFKHCCAIRALLLKVHLIAIHSLPKRQPCLWHQQIGYTCNCSLPLHAAL